jgi:hypothetical protein
MKKRSNEAEVPIHVGNEMALLRDRLEFMQASLCDSDRQRRMHQRRRAEPLARSCVARLSWTDSRYI